MKNWYKNFSNKIHSFLVKYDAVITVVLGILLFPCVIAACYMFIATPLALEDLGLFAIENFDYCNPNHILYLSSCIGACTCMWIASDFVFDFASAVNALIHGKKSRIEEKKNEHN